MNVAIKDWIRYAVNAVLPIALNFFEDFYVWHFLSKA